MSLQEELKKEPNVATMLAVFLFFIVTLIFWLVLQAIPTSKSIETEEDHLRKIRSNGWRYAQLIPDETESSNYDSFVANVATKIFEAEEGLFKTYRVFLACNSAADCSTKLLLPDLGETGITTEVIVTNTSCVATAIIRVDHPLADKMQVRIINIHTCPPWMMHRPSKVNT